MSELYRRSIYDDEFERCRAAISQLFERKPGLEPGPARLGLRSPQTALDRYLMPLAEECINNLLAAPAQLGERGLINDYVRSVTHCVRARGLAVRDVQYEQLLSELLSAVRACLESQLLSSPDPELPSRRRALYAKAVQECVMSVVICLHRTADALGLGVTAGELRV